MPIGPKWNVVKTQLLSVTVGACLDQINCSIKVAKWDCEIVMWLQCNCQLCLQIEIVIRPWKGQGTNKTTRGSVMKGFECTWLILIDFKGVYLVRFLRGCDYPECGITLGRRKCRCAQINGEDSPPVAHGSNPGTKGAQQGRRAIRLGVVPNPTTPTGPTTSVYHSLKQDHTGCLLN